MKTIQSINRYVVRHKDLQGGSHEENVSAFDAMEAQDLAMELNAELKKQPNLINAIPKAN